MTFSLNKMLCRAFAASLIFAVSALALAQLAPPVASPIGSPRLALTSPGEKPVRLQSVKVDVEISGGQAITSVEMRFFNPNRRVLEGELQFPLLDGQQIVGFALDIDGALRAAVPVEKARGQQVFEDIARQGVDPGLLSQSMGNNYKLRVYPLPAQGVRRVLIRYAESLSVRDGNRHYRLPLAYAETLDSLNLQVSVRSPAMLPTSSGVLGQLELARVGTDYRAEIEHQHFAQKGWLALKIPSPISPEIRTQQIDGQSWFVAEVPVADVVKRIPRSLPRVIGVLWDSSGSAAERDHAQEFALLDAYFKRLGNGEVRLIRLRDQAEVAERFLIRGGEWKMLRKALEATPYDGATRLSAFKPDPGIGEYLLFSDGLENYGDEAFPKTSVPVHALLASLRNDAGHLCNIADRNGGRFIDFSAVKSADAEHLLLDESVRLEALEGTGVSALLAASPYPVDGRLQVAGRLDGAEGQVRLTVRRGHKTQIVPVNVSRHEASDSLAALTWARLKIAALEGEYRLHRTEIQHLGEQFGLVTRETSLIVLDRAEDYARHGIKPPPELRAEVERLRQVQAKSDEDERKSHLEQVVNRFNERKAWWSKEFPKTSRPLVVSDKKQRNEPMAAESAVGAMMFSEVDAPRRPAPAQRMAKRDMPSAAPFLEAAAPVSKSKEEDRAAVSSSTAIRLQAFTPNAPYSARLRHADTADLYAIYLDERKANAHSTAFYLDVADLFFERQQRELGLRILSNLAEMDLENRHILRILGYRLIQAEAPKQAIVALQRVLELAPNEPQSWRDLGLAYAAAGEPQKAADHLLEVVIRPWHGRFPDIEQTALSELNALLATSAQKLDASRLDPRLSINMPLDLRVVLAWDADNTDIDLWVTDPNGEKAFYAHPLSYQGGRMSADFTGGYGPEEFSLKQAKPGKYKVEANFFGHRQQIVAGATTLQVKLSSRFGTPEAEEKMITLRLKGKSEVVYVGEFEVK